MVVELARRINSNDGSSISSEAVTMDRPPARVIIHTRGQPDRGIYDKVPPWISLDRPEPPFEEMISPEGWPPQYLEVLKEDWVFKCENLQILMQYLKDPYHLKYSHLGRYHRGWSGDETLVFRGFELGDSINGNKPIISRHWFILDRRQLLQAYTGIPEDKVNEMFPRSAAGIR